MKKYLTKNICDVSLLSDAIVAILSYAFTIYRKRFQGMRPKPNSWAIVLDKFCSSSICFVSSKFVQTKPIKFQHLS